MSAVKRLLVLVWKAALVILVGAWLVLGVRIAMTDSRPEQFRLWIEMGFCLSISVGYGWPMKTDYTAARKGGGSFTR